MSAPTTTRSQRSLDAQMIHAAGPLSGNQEGPDAHYPRVAGTSSLSHSENAHQGTATEGPSSDRQVSYGAQDPLAVGSLLDGQGSTHTQLISPSTSSASGQKGVDTHAFHAAAGSLPPAAMAGPHPNEVPRRGPFLYDPLLCLLADSLDDLEQLRIATNNRLRALTNTEPDADGEYRGLGLDIRSPQVARATVMAEGIAKLEHQAELDMNRALRKSSLHPWVERSVGVGQKQAARLLAVLGDPYWNDLHDRPRTVSELWAYAGYAVLPGQRVQRRERGAKSNWSDIARSRTFVIAESCIKQRHSPYRVVYDEARKQYETAVHPNDCPRCGPAGNPALAGSPLSLGHQHARAMRRVAKAILKDLWLEARDIHLTAEEYAA